jgi:hypothetical protein
LKPAPTAPLNYACHVRPQPPHRAYPDERDPDHVPDPRVARAKGGAGPYTRRSSWRGRLLPHLLKARAACYAPTGCGCRRRAPGGVGVPGRCVRRVGFCGAAGPSGGRPAPEPVRFANRRRLRPGLQRHVLSSRRRWLPGRLRRNGSGKPPHRILHLPDRHSGLASAIAGLQSTQPDANWMLPTCRRGECGSRVEVWSS